MTSPARKSNDSKARQIHSTIPPKARKLALGVVTRDDSQFVEIFAGVFNVLQNFIPEGDFLIGHCSPVAQSCHVEFAANGLASVRGLTLDVSQQPLAALLNGPETFVVVNAQDLARSEAALRELTSGQVAVFRIDLAGDLSAIIMFWQHASAGPISQERIKALGTIADLAGRAAVSADLTFDVQAQQLHLETLRSEIIEVQQFYRQFSDAIQQCFWVIDLDAGKALVISENFERVWGASRSILYDEITGFMKTVLPADRDRVLSEFHLKLGGELDTELRVIGPDGEVRWIWLRIFPTRNHAAPQDPNNSRRVVVIADDITEKKTEEESLRAREADLIARARMLAVGDLANGVAHEINNPLTVIVGKAAEVKRMAANVHSGKFDPTVIAAAAEKIQKTSIRISEIISSLKSLSRHEKTVMQRQGLEKIFHELRDMTSEKFRSYNVGITVQELPNGFSAELNATMISQMLLNLINNAFDAVQKEDEKWVKVEFTEDDHSIYLFVTDSGPGIPIKIRSRIFDPFFTTKDPGQGTGLGLSLAAGIAAHHHGMLRLDTMHPHTRFVVQLPKTQPYQKST